MKLTFLNRRAVLAGAAASMAAVRSNAQLPRFAAAIDAALDVEGVHSLSLSVAGRTILSEVFCDPPLTTPLNVGTAARPVLSALTGIAIEKGYLNSLEQRVAPILARSLPARPDPRLDLLTIENLLAMQAGLRSVSGPAGGAWRGSPDWVRHALAQPFMADPGRAMIESTGNYHLMGAILSIAAGHDLLWLARTWLGRPASMAIEPWFRDPQGRYVGGDDMFLTPEALLRLGELHALGGLWNGRAVLPRNWVAQALTPRATSRETGDSFGLGWFLRRFGGEQGAYAGTDEHTVWILPGLEAAVAVTSKPGLRAEGERMAKLHALVS
ncbi:MAG: serine hydrolase domain-containing protein, partial [Tranquillimonas sp.]